MIELDIAVVGGGFSGCALAAQLAPRVGSQVTLALFEPGEIGRGAAYGTRHPEHILNTRAGMMSLFPSDPDHFVRWLGSRAAPSDFVSRRLYGTYVSEIAQRALDHPGFSHVGERVRAVRRRADGFEIETESGRRFAGRRLVLATGNPLPADSFLPPEVRAHRGYVGDPWRFDYGTIRGDVLIVGSGLTALDALVALKAAGHRGTVHLLSRHRRFPHVHAQPAAYDVVPALDARDVRGLLRGFRAHVARARERGLDWRSVVDAVRPESEAIWRRLPTAERRRFERHLRVHWERHRHRAPQSVDGVLREYQASEEFFAHAGRLAGMSGGVATIALRAGGTLELAPEFIVNCTGAGTAAAMLADPLLGAMLEEGSISISAQGLGLRTTPDLAAIDRAGLPASDLFVLGPPVRGSRFEATAVPELRGMAELVAERLANEPEIAKKGEAFSQALLGPGGYNQGNQGGLEAAPFPVQTRERHANQIRGVGGRSAAAPP